MNKIVITGPECSGKTTLAKTLWTKHGGALVPEFARSYLSVRPGKYNRHDLDMIATGQVALEDATFGISEGLIFHDTGYYVLKIWSELKFGEINPYIESIYANRHYDHYILCSPDVDWSQDGLRENPQDRWSIFYLYHKALIDNQESFLIVDGPLEKRLNQVGEFIQKSSE